MEKVTMVKFWSGNRSEARQVYEREVLNTIMKATEPDWGAWQIQESLDDYPGDEESMAFAEKGQDLLVTVAGNQKFRKDEVIMIPHPITKNLLGYRVLIIREEDAELFGQMSNASDLKKLRHGIPLTWCDAEIFRHNQYNVLEEGSFDDIFERLQSGRVDYIAFGANEVLGVYYSMASRYKGLIIEKNILLYYQFPLVFYVNPQVPRLAKRIEDGFQKISSTGKLNSIFDHHYGNIVEQLNLNNRVLFTLDNPLIPDEFRHLKPDLDNL